MFSIPWKNFCQRINIRFFYLQSDSLNIVVRLCSLFFLSSTCRVRPCCFFPDASCIYFYLTCIFDQVALNSLLAPDMFHIHPSMDE